MTVKLNNDDYILAALVLQSDERQEAKRDEEVLVSMDAVDSETFSVYAIQDEFWRKSCEEVWESFQPPEGKFPKRLIKTKAARVWSDDEINRILPSLNVRYQLKSIKHPAKKPIVANRSDFVRFQFSLIKLKEIHVKTENY